LPAETTGDEKPRPGIGTFHVGFVSLDQFRDEKPTGATPCRSSPWKPSQSCALAGRQKQTASKTTMQAFILVFRII
jgi:hypothetical protein